MRTQILPHRSLFVGFVLTLLLPSSVWAQATAPDNVPKLLDIPPLLFSNLSNSHIDFSRDFEFRQGCIVNIIKWTASNGDFKYVNDQGVVIHGKLKNFSLKGKMAAGDSPCGRLLEVDTGGLKFKLTLDEDFNVAAFGGVVTLPVRAKVTVTNNRPINISRWKPVNSEQPVQVNRSGAFTLTTTDQLSWTDCKLKFAALPDPIVVSLIDASKEKKQFEIPLETGRPLVADAKFTYASPGKVVVQPRHLSAPLYQATINDLSLDALQLFVTRSGLTLEIHNVSVSGEGVAKSGVPPPVPILFKGRATATSITGRAQTSFTQADVRDVVLTGFKFVPTTPVSLAAVKQMQMDRSYQHSQVAQTFSDTSVGAHNNQVMQTQAAPPCNQATANQLADIAKLGMLSLTDGQTEAIRASQLNLDRIDKADYVIHFANADLKEVIDKFVSSLFGQKLSIELGNQMILACANFSPIPPLPGVPPVAVKIILKVSTSFEAVPVERDGKVKQELALVLRFEVAQAALDGTIESRETSPDGLKNSVDNQLMSVNSKVKLPPSKVVLPLPLQFIRKLSLSRSKTDKETGDKFDITAKTVEATVEPIRDMTVLLIDVKGIHILGKVKIQVDTQ